MKRCSVLESLSAQGFGFCVLVCRLALLCHGFLGFLLDLMPVAVKAEYEDTFVADVQLALLAPPAPSGLSLPALLPRCAGAGAAVVPPGVVALFAVVFVVFSMGMLVALFRLFCTGSLPSTQCRALRQRDEFEFGCVVVFHGGC